MFDVADYAENVSSFFDELLSQIATDEPVNPGEQNIFSEPVIFFACLHFWVALLGCREFVDIHFGIFQFAKCVDGYMNTNVLVALEFFLPAYEF